MTNLLPFAIAWGVLAVIVMGLAFRRRSISGQEDDMVHLSGGTDVVSHQVEVAKRLDALDKWGKILTIVLVLTGICLAAMYAMQIWNESTKAGLI